MNKTKPGDVKKALECCSRCSYTDGDLCHECPFYERCRQDPDILEREALAVLLENDAEIDRLNKEVDRLSQVVLYHDAFANDAIADAKAETATEFAERLKETLIASGIYPAVVKSSIEKVKKELEENNAKRTD